MENIANKSDATAGASGELPASQYNDHKEELQGAVVRSGQTLSASVLLQLAKALFINGVSSQTCVDSGSDDTILLSPLTGTNGLVVPDAYAHLDGAILRFEKLTPNVSTAVSINFGQTGTELSAKTLVRTDGSVPAIGDVIGCCTVRWDNSNDRWILVSNGADTFLDTISDAGTYTPVFKKAQLVLDTGLGDAGATIEDGTYLNQEIILSNQGTGFATYFHPDFNYGIIVDTDHNPVIKWVSDGVGGFKWDVGSQVTANYVSGLYTIKKTSIGGLVLDFYGENIPASYTFAFPLPFANVSYSSYVSGEELGGRYFVLNKSGKTVSQHTGIWSSTAGDNRLQAKFEGEYA